jgi:peptidoglycan/xylan/chitin deacetylase (PgdA/CDA1 family)
VRRIAIASLPALAAVALLIVLLGSHGHGRPASPETAKPGASTRRDPSRRKRSTVVPPAPAQVRGAAARHMAIPILTYHVIGTPAPGTPNLGLWVRPDVFAGEMAALRRAGYWAVTLAQAWRGWTRGGPLPRRPAVVSFDDGYRGDYTKARPVLRRLGWPGVLNLELNDVGPRNLPASEVRGLIRAGWEVDSHTITHPDLTTVSPGRLRYEVVGSRRAIRRRFGMRADFFCYPAGRYNTTVQAAVRGAGYLAATTEDEGFAPAGAPYALRRVRVNGTDTPATLMARLAAERPRSATAN